MLLHMGTGKPVLISIPRDSYVPIPGHGQNKINAALAFGGPTLLVQTVEAGHRPAASTTTWASASAAWPTWSNTVGGVQMCVKTAVPADPTGDSGFKGLAAGCHNLNGTQAIAFVRDRHSFATSDLQRIQDQRAFLSALLSKATSPGVYLNPFTALPFGSTAASSIAVDKGTSLYDLLQAAHGAARPADRHRADRERQLPDERRGRGAVGPDAGARTFQRAEGGQGRPRRAAERHEGRLRTPGNDANGAGDNACSVLGGLSNAVLVYVYL